MSVESSLPSAPLGHKRVLLGSWILWLLVMLFVFYLFDRNGPHMRGWTREWTVESRFSFGALFLVYLVSLFSLAEKYLRFTSSERFLASVGKKILFALAWSGGVTGIWALSVVILKVLLHVMPTTNLDLGTLIGGFFGVLGFVVSPGVVLSMLFLGVYKALTKPAEQRV